MAKTLVVVKERAGCIALIAGAKQGVQVSAVQKTLDSLKVSRERFLKTG